MTFNAAAGATGPSGPQGAPEDLDSLPAANTPLDGTEKLDVVQSGTHSRTTTAHILPFWSVSLVDGTLTQVADGAGQTTFLGLTGQTVVSNSLAGVDIQVFSATDAPFFEGDRARGTIASPAAVQAGDILAQFLGFGYGTTGYAIGDDWPGVWIEAAGTFTDTSAPTSTGIYTTPAGSLNAIERFSVEADGGICIPSAYAAPTTGQTVTMAAGVRNVIINPLATLATLTVSLPPTPTDGQRAGFASTKIITALTVSAQSSKSVAGALGALAVGGAQNFVYREADTTWYPAP